ncbi:MAG TPA: tRNA (adenosine(37)-N6)-dimethylallyltransferase MiaA [Candidatus Acidoferrales bacterium]|nr:tRNA (adenosine(37)-N6)-dimethylallyltransferase MiaA [Candidatus Acidoferrales bacterium]
MTDRRSSPAPLVAIVGPTASGKSALGVWLAEWLDGEVLVCDSTQVYREFDIGTAKLPPGERRGVPHHLMDLVEAGEVFHAGEYRRRAAAALEAVVQRGKLPIFTVGTGLYLRALLEGLSEAPERSQELRERLARRAAAGSARLHRLLARIDPAGAKRIGARDIPKMIRAIEVRLLSGKPLSALHRAGRKGLEGYRPIKIGLAPPRRALCERIDRRVEAMFERGWVEEVRGLVARGVPPSAKPFQFIGYAALREHLEAGLPLHQAAERIRAATRRYAKRQMTWFRREPGVHWLEGFGDDPRVAHAALDHIQKEVSQ